MGWFWMFFSTITLVSALFFYRIWLWIIERKKPRMIFTALYALFVSLFVIGRYISRAYPELFINDFMVICGSFSLIILFYGFIGSIAAEAVRLSVKFLFRIRGIFYNDKKVKRIIALMVFGAVTVTVLSGFLNARTRAVKTIYLESEMIKKQTSIVFLSDVHFGRIIGRKDAHSLVSSINALNPDIVIFGGDFFDENIFSVKRNNIKEYLQKIHAPLGVFAVTGNHEFIGGVDEAVKYMEESGFHVLRNRMIKAGPLFIAGRDDFSSVRITKANRVRLDEITGTQKITGPLIVVDHQPKAIGDSVRAKAFLHLSGHTHDGQFWPLPLVLPLWYDQIFGLTEKADTFVYVSSGWGFWGPPVRVATTPEIVKFVISPKK